MAHRDRKVVARPGRTVVARAPGRVNLVGDHTDYNQGLALPMAIGLATEVARRTGPDVGRPGWLAVTSTLDGRTAWIPVDGATPLPTGSPPWAALAAAVVAEVRRRDDGPSDGGPSASGPLDGGTARITSTIPVGAGLSSSAAFTVALARALGAEASPAGLARLGQRAEAAVGADVGLMDPLVIAGARAGHAMLLDFADSADPANLVGSPDVVVDQVPVPAEAVIVVVHSGQQRLLAAGDSPYGVRRAECAAAARHVGRPLGAATDDDVAGLGDPVLRRRARHVVTECRRVRQVAEAFGRGDLRAAGQAMTESHRSLAGDLAASTPTVDALVDHLVGRPGVLGARMTGGGFGGCVVALTRPGAVDPAEWPGRAWLVAPSGGATVRVVTGVDEMEASAGTG